MPDYKKLYFSLFNDVTDAIEILKKIQTTSEERYLESCNKSQSDLQNSISFSDRSPLQNPKDKT